MLPLNSKRLLPVCTGGQRLAPPEDCGGARAYMEAGDPRWRACWDALPREELKRMAEAVQHFLNSGGDRSAIGDRETLRAALERVKAHQALRHDRLDRRAINRRLQQYARGERAWLFCDTVGG
jgi:hypothetical protein